MREKDADKKTNLVSDDRIVGRESRGIVVRERLPRFEGKKKRRAPLWRFS